MKAPFHRVKSKTFQAGALLHYINLLWKSNMMQPGAQPDFKWFNYCRWRELCNCRIQRGYLVRDVKIKNKPPVSWSRFPPGSRLSVSCLFISLGRRDYKWCELCGWNSQLGMYSTFELCTCFVISASLRFLLVILVKLAPPLTTSYMQEEHFNGWDQA